LLVLELLTSIFTLAVATKLLREIHTLKRCLIADCVESILADFKYFKRWEGVKNIWIYGWPLISSRLFEVVAFITMYEKAND
jgi:hypothetical protein